MCKPNKAFYIMSGGMDSTLAALEVKNNYHWHYPIFFDWGQKAKNDEFNAVEKICELLEFDAPRIIKIPICDWDQSELAQGNPNSISDKNNIMVPERNFAFIAVAASYARAKGGGDLIVGFNNTDCGYDAKDKFVEHINGIFEHENNELVNAQDTYIKSSKIKLLAPLLEKDKKYIFNALNGLGYLELTYSCYVANGPCGTCPACQRRNDSEGK